MRTIKLILAYDGTAYAGWQRQKQQPTIQAVIEDMLERMTNMKISLAGAGRTDAGVHALGMAASFRTDCTIPLEGLQNGLNSMLPEDIRVVSVSEEQGDFHARYNAIAKTYQYRLTFGAISLPTERLYAINLRKPLNFKNLEPCLQMITGSHDFSSFEATGSRDRNKEGGRGGVRNLLAARYINELDNLRLGCFEFVGDGFLRHMVRNLVGTLLEVGQGRKTVADFQRILNARDRNVAGPTAPARGLFLQTVIYDAKEIEGAVNV